MGAWEQMQGGATMDAIQNMSRTMIDLLETERNRLAQEKSIASSLEQIAAALKNISERPQ